MCSGCDLDFNDKTIIVMKKYLILIILGVSGLVSCTDSFLEEKMVSTITQDYFNTEAGLEQLVIGTRDAVRWKYGWSEGPFLFHVGTDAELRGTASWDMYSPTVWSPTGSMGNTNANYLVGYVHRELLGGYPVINNCNRAIQTIRENPPGRFAEDTKFANRYLAEALFNRAWFYYLLNTQLGSVPLLLEYFPGLPNSFNFPKASSEEIYKQIIGDLRFCFEHLPAAGEEDLQGVAARERYSKGAAAHFLTKLYLQRAQGAEFAGASDEHLKMLYKGNVSTDLDSCIHFATHVIDNSAFYRLEADYADIFSVEKGSYPSENSSDIILAAPYAPGGVAAGRFGMRYHRYWAGEYNQSTWGLPSATWTYGCWDGVSLRVSDWGYDVFTDKMADSRFEKTFQVEFRSMLESGGADADYYDYSDSRNQTDTWTASEAAYFNEHIGPGYDRASWGGRRAVAGEHKIGRGDLGLVFLENTKETAIPLAEALAQPYVLHPRWVRDGDKYYYRRDATNDFTANNLGLEKGLKVAATVKKHIDVNRTQVVSDYGTRNVAIFRIAETYLLRAEAYGRKNLYSQAIEDINRVRRRAAYKAGEERAEVIARLYPGSENLTASERQYPYAVAEDRTGDMEIDARYWDGSSPESAAENYPSSANTEEKRFVHFIYNEITRELIGEQMLYEGIHHAGLQAERIQWHSQMGSTMQNHWPVADNLEGSQGQNGNGKGSFQAHYTFKPWPQNLLNMLTDENGTPLDEAGKSAFQNPGYR